MESVAELPALIPAKPRLPHAFTRENARQFTLRANEAKRANKERKAAERIANGADQPASYVRTRLVRVRAQLERIDSMIQTETDPQKLDRLVSAQSRLSEQWRIFSGIPLPGSRRPGREKPDKRSAGTGPLDAE